MGAGQCQLCRGIPILAKKEPTPFLDLRDVLFVSILSFFNPHEVGVSLRSVGPCAAEEGAAESKPRLSEVTLACRFALRASVSTAVKYRCRLSRTER